MSRSILTAALFFCSFASSAQTINRQAVITWDAPSSCAGGGDLTLCPILSYSVQKLNDTTWTQLGTTTAAIRTYTDSNLALGTHTYRILARSEAGDSAPSLTVAKSFDVPGAPGNLVITITIEITQ